MRLSIGEDTSKETIVTVTGEHITLTTGMGRVQVDLSIAQAEALAAHLLTATRAVKRRRQVTEEATAEWKRRQQAKG